MNYNTANQLDTLALVQQRMQEVVLNYDDSDVGVATALGELTAAVAALALVVQDFIQERS